MPEQRDYFISYTQADREWAEWIDEVLKQAGYTTHIQSVDMPPGTDFVRKMEEAIDQSRQLLAVLSPDYLKSHFATQERTAFLAQKRSVIPVRVRECEPPALLRAVVYVDLVGMTRGDEARDELLAGIRSSPAMVRPRRWPRFALFAAVAVAAFLGVLPIAFRSTPEVYRLRVEALTPAGTAATGARLTLSTGGEINQTANGWEAVIPRSALPANRQVTLRAELPSAFLRGEATVGLDSVASIPVTIRLHANRTARVRGTVIDANGTALAGVRISVDGHAEYAVTGDNGEFDLSAHAADGQTIRIRARHGRLGEESMEVLAGDFQVQVVLSQTP